MLFTWTLTFSFIRSRSVRWPWFQSEVARLLSGPSHFQIVESMDARGLPEAARWQARTPAHSVCPTTIMRVIVGRLVIVKARHDRALSSKKWNWLRNVIIVVLARFLLCRAGWKWLLTLRCSSGWKYLVQGGSTRVLHGRLNTLSRESIFRSSHCWRVFYYDLNLQLVCVGERYRLQYQQV